MSNENARGGPQFATTGTKGSGETLATTQRPELVQVLQSQSEAVGSGNEEVVEIYAPAGSVYTLNDLYFDAPPVGGAGEHRFQLRSISAFDVLRGESQFSSGLEFTRSVWNEFDQRWPTNEAATLMALKEVRATETEPMVLKYYNGTDEDQTGERTIALNIEENSY